MQHTWIYDGRALGEIVISNVAGEAERFAAEELARYFKIMSDIEMPIMHGVRLNAAHAIIILDASRPMHRRFVDQLPVDQLKDDGYLIQSHKQNLYIVANDPFGVVFGVYQYLRNYFGVCFHDMGRAGEDIPREKTLAHESISELRNPKLNYRGTQMAFDPQRIDWMAKNGFNYTRIGASNKPLAWWDPVLASMTPHLRKRGIRITFGHHTFEQLLPIAMYGSEAPDYFVERDGEPAALEQFYWSLQNPIALDEVTYNLEQFIARHPEIDMFDFWPADGICDLTQEDFKAVTGEPELQRGDWEKHVAGATLWSRLGDPNKARVYAELTRRVAVRLGERFPKLKIAITAYADLVQPCPQVKLPENVVCFIAIYWRCRTHGLLDEQCHINRQFKQVVSEWTQMYAGQDVYISEYYSAMGSYMSLPYPCLTHMFDELQGMTDMGVTGAKVHTGREMDAQSAIYNINFLAFSSFVWGEDASVDAFLSRYCRDFFGEASEYVQAVYTHLEQAVQSAVHTQPAMLSLGMPSLDQVFTDAILQSCRELLRDGIAATTDAKVIHRISRLLMVIDYTHAAMQLAAPMLDRVAKLRLGESTDELDTLLLPGVTAMVQRCRRMCELDLNVFGYQRPSVFFNDVVDGIKPKRNRWELLEASLLKQNDAAEFNTDILQARQGVKG